MAAPSARRLTWVAAGGDAPGWLKDAAMKTGVALSSSGSWAEAADIHRTDSSAMFVVPQGEAPGRATIAKYFKGGDPPVILEALNSTDTPLWPKSHGGNVLSESFTAGELDAALEDSAHARRAGKRLAALRAHQTRGLDLQGNPALSLITTLVKACTAAADTKDLLRATLTLQGAVQFSEAALLLLDASHRISELHFWSKDENRGGITSTFPEGESILHAPEFESPSAVLFRSDHALYGELSRFNRFPWGTALCLGFRAPGLDPKNQANRALLVVFKKDLIPFSEKDSWILELAFHPLSLALEKVLTLRIIDDASQQWRSTFDGISQPISVIDDEFRIVKANRSMADLVCEDVRTLKGKRCYQLIAGRRSPCPRCPATTHSREAAGTRVRTRSGSDHLVWSHRIRTGRKNYKFQFYRNVAKEQELTSQLIQAEKMAALGALVNAIAHELNNPIAGILATAQLLRKLCGKENPDDLLEDLAEIEAGALRAKRIISMLLGFTQSSIRDADESTVAENVQTTLLLAKSALTGVKVQVSSSCPELSVQNASIHQQILFNLVTNAAHAMAGRGSIWIETRKVGSILETIVTDTGPGIAAAHLARVFDPFVTTKAEGEGTGLGLSIVKNLAEKLGGSVRIESKQGQGTKFFLRIPACAEDGGST